MLAVRGGAAALHACLPACLPACLHPTGSQARSPASLPTACLEPRLAHLHADTAATRTRTDSGSQQHQAGEEAASPVSNDIPEGAVMAHVRPCCGCSVHQPQLLSP